MRWTPWFVGSSVGLLLFLVARKASASGVTVTTDYKPVQYPPKSEALTQLLRDAAAAAGLPEAWATSEGAHEIIRRESNGWIGRPNYTISGAKDKTQWPAIIEKLRAGIKVSSVSNAAGLGQMLPSNMKAFAPDGVKGFGVPLQEAIAFLKYIHSRYGDPAVAVSMHNNLGEYVNSRSGITQKKTFKEGY